MRSIYRSYDGLLYDGLFDISDVAFLFMHGIPAFEILDIVQIVEFDDSGIAVAVVVP